MKNVSIKILRKVYGDLKIDYPIGDFIKALESESKAASEKEDRIEEEKRLAKIEEAKLFYVENYFETVPDNYKDCIGCYIDEIVDGMDWWDTFYDYDGMDDEGETISQYFLIGEKLYLVDIHCEAEWCGDYSSRKNLPGPVGVESFVEVEGFDIVEKFESNGDCEPSVRVKLH